MTELTYRDDRVTRLGEGDDLRGSTVAQTHPRHPAPLGSAAGARRALVGG